MALADPLGLAAFADLLRIAETTFSLDWQQERSTLGGGDTLARDLGPARWVANCRTVVMTREEAHGIMALINSRAGALKTFLLYDHSMPYPSSDLAGATFGAVTPVVGTITNRYVAAFTGFPNNYVMPLGTYIQIISDTSRYYLGQFAEAKTASGAGAITATELSPKLPASVSPGDAVTVLKPAAKFRLVPGSAAISWADVLNCSISFTAEQTYAA